MSRVGNDMQSAATSFLDGTDCVMLSGESAMGRYPVESVEMLSRIAAEIEPYRTSMPIKEALQSSREEDEIKLKDLIALSVETALKRVTPPTLIVPTRSGATARSIARFKLPVWITAVSSNAKTCQNLMFSYGVFPVCETDHPENWKSWATNTIQLVYQSISFICWKSFNLNKKED